MVHYGPLLYRSVPGTCPNLYSKGGGSGHSNPKIVGGIVIRGREHVLVFILNPK